MIQALANGLVNGTIYVLVALSLTIIYSIFRVPHFGLGGILVWGAFMAYFAVNAFKLNFLMGVVFAAASMAALGLVVEKVAFKPLRASTEGAIFVSAVGVLIALENAALVLWGDANRSISIPKSLDFTVAIPGVLYLPAMRVLIFVVVMLVIVGLWLLIKKTKMGKSMRAVAQDRVAARLLGVPIDRVASYTFALGSAMAGVAGAFLAAGFAFVYHMGGMLILKGFVIVVLGGLGSVGGAIVGGFILGVADSLTLTYVTSEFKNLVTFSLLILILVIRPQGIFGEIER